MNIEEEKKLIVEKILTTKNKNLVAKISKLIEKEQTNTYWNTITAELRAELENGNKARIFKEQGIEGLLDDETVQSLKKYSKYRLS